MPRVELRLEPNLHEKLLAAKPKSLSLPAFCAFIIEGTLDTPVTLGGPSEAGTPSITSYITSNKRDRTVVSEIKSAGNSDIPEPEPKPKKRRKRSEPADGGPEFEAFWKQYLALQHRSNGQTKPAAVEAWTKVCKQITPAQLRGALSAAVNHQSQMMRETGWAAPFPDCHRWLNKGYWQQFVDASSPVEAPLTPRPIFDPTNPDEPF